jgi:hypothetical protein
VIAKIPLLAFGRDRRAYEIETRRSIVSGLSSTSFGLVFRERKEDRCLRKDARIEAAFESCSEESGLLGWRGHFGDSVVDDLPALGGWSCQSKVYKAERPESGRAGRDRAALFHFLARTRGGTEGFAGLRKGNGSGTRKAGSKKCAGQKAGESAEGGDGGVRCGGKFPGNGFPDDCEREDADDA